MTAWVSLILLVITVNVYALRVSKPLTLTYPITAEQVSQLNKYLEEIWLIQNGRQELDVVSSSKTSPKNGEIWLNSGTNKIEFRIGGVTYSAP